MANAPAAWLPAGWTPTVCARHGEPPVSRHKVPFVAKPPEWALVLALFGALPYLIVMVFRKRTFSAAWPFCGQCEARHRRWLIIGGSVFFGGVFAIGAAFAFNRPDIAIVWGALLLLGLVALIVGPALAAKATWRAIADGHVSQDGVWMEFDDADSRFYLDVSARVSEAQQAQQAREAAPAATE